MRKNEKIFQTHLNNKRALTNTINAFSKLIIGNHKSLLFLTLFLNEYILLVFVSPL